MSTSTGQRSGLRHEGEAGVSGSSIEYVCVAATHNAPARESSDTLVHEGTWAYCRAGVVDGHKWQRVAPVAIEVLRAHDVEIEPAGVSGRH